MNYQKRKIQALYVFKVHPFFIVHMTETHNYSFFGQKTGMIVQSSSQKDPYIFFKLLKKNENGAWEKPSKGEGKTIKFSLEELVLILQVLKHGTKTWSAYHKFKGNTTQISFAWQEETEKTKNKTLFIKIGNYPKMLNFAQAEVLKLLLAHILKEKIKFATSSRFSQSTNAQVKPKQKVPELYVVEEVYSN